MSGSPSDLFDIFCGTFVRKARSRIAETMTSVAFGLVYAFRTSEFVLGHTQDCSQGRFGLRGRWAIAAWSWSLKSLGALCDEV